MIKLIGNCIFFTLNVVDFASGWLQIRPCTLDKVCSVGICILKADFSGVQPVINCCLSG